MANSENCLYALTPARIHTKFYRIHVLRDEFVFFSLCIVVVVSMSFFHCWCSAHLKAVYYCPIAMTQIRFQKAF